MTHETPRGRAKSRQRRNRIIIACVTIVLAAVTVYFAAFLISASKVVDKIEMEAGIRLTASDFYKEHSETASFALDCPPFYYDVPGTYTVKVKDGWFAHDVKLIVRDTVDPVADAKKVTLVSGDEARPEDFVENVVDATKLTITFAMAPNMDKSGEQTVIVSLKDLAGNETLVTSQLSIVPVYPEVIIEAGSEPITVQNLVFGDVIASSSMDLEEIDYHHIGEYDTIVTANGQEYPCKIYVKDTTEPVLEVTDLHACVGFERGIEDFVTTLSDATDVTLSMSGTADYTQEGETQLAITATDEGGNSVTKEVLLTVEIDNEAPVIAGPDSFTSFQGETISYRSHVTVSDNSGFDVELSIDASKVNNQVLGDYTVYYTATDMAGNTSTREVLVSITERTYTDEDLYQRIDSLLAQIITDDMDETQKARAVYDWVKGNITYTGSSDKTNFNKAAIEGLLDLKGDCYTNSCICVACFTRLGMDARIVKKVPIVSMYRHWWLMVEVDGKWYHMDTCPRTWDKPEIFLWTETQLSEYSARNTETHNYDRSLYPAVTP